MGWKRWMVTAALVGVPGCDSCVARGSRVRTRDGERPIEDLRVGDEVISFDPTDGAPISGAILAIRSATRETVLLRAGDAELVVTSDHPVYCPDERVYAPAGDWAIGRRSHLWQLGDDGPRSVRVDFTSTDGGVREVFDLSVDTPHHNFLADTFLVHNKRGPFPDCDYEGARVQYSAACECPDGTESGRIVCEGDTGRCDCPAHDGGTDGG